MQGTKGSDKAENLASVQTKKAKDKKSGDGDEEEEEVVVEEQTQQSIDERFMLSTAVMQAQVEFQC